MLPQGMRASAPSTPPPSLGFHNVSWRRVGIRSSVFTGLFLGSWYIVETLPFFQEQRAALATALAGDAPKAAAS
jgi:hypothetical protein